MNLVALKKLDWIVSNIWKEDAKEYLASIGLEYDPEKPIFEFLKKLNARGQYQNVNVPESASS